MKKLITIIGAIIIALILVNFQCNDNIVDPPPGHPPGYQEDIPWPSLADSPWPMYRGDPQNTGRSSITHIFAGTIFYVNDTTKVSSGITVAEDSTLYVIATNGLFAFDKKGNLKWNYHMWTSNTTPPAAPLIDAEGTIYTSSIPDTFFAFNPDGTVNWKRNIDCLTTGINIGLDGTLYFLGLENNVTTLYSVSKAGNINWKITNSSFNTGDLSGLSFSPDGKTLYIPGYTGAAVYAIDINSQSIKWQFGDDHLVLFNAPLVDSDGNIYIVSNNENDAGYLYSLNPNGEIRWKYFLHTSFLSIRVMPHFSMDKNGNLYFGQDTLYSIDYEGKLRWKYGFSNTDQITSDISIDSNNNIYFTIRESAPNKQLCSFNEEGELLWQIPVPQSQHFANLSIGFGYNYIISPSFKGNVFYLIK